MGHIQFLVYVCYADVLRANINFIKNNIEALLAASGDVDIGVKSRKIKDEK